MGFTTGLLIVVVLYLCHLYRTMAQKGEVLEQNCEILKDKLAPFEKDGGSLRSKVTEGGDVELKAEISQLKKKVAIHRAEVEGLERLMREYKEEDQEEKLCLIEGMKRIGGFLGFEHGAEEAVEEETAVGQENGCSKIREERW